MNTRRLDGNRALVNGGSCGIGTSIVRRLPAEGASVAVNYVSDAESAIGSGWSSPATISFRMRR